MKAVLKDLRRRAVSRILNLGDCVYGPLDPAGTADLLVGLEMPGVRGNQDRVLLEPSALSPPPNSTLEFVVSSLTPAHRAWIENLPPTLQLDDRLFLCHGSPWSDEEHFLEEVRPAGVFLRSPESLSARAASMNCEVILCAHSHVPRTIQAAGRLIVNPGSVGLPAYTDDLPFPHAMESGSPHARYALLSCDSADGGWQVEHIAVPYDWERAAHVAASHGRADWAQWIRSGRAASV